MLIIDNPNKFADKYSVKSSRLNNWDYSNSGYYFITICTLNHNNFFGKIVANKIDLSKTGIIANQCLIDIPKHFSNIHLDEYVVMPNHMHFLVRVETRDRASLHEQSKITLINYGYKNHPNYFSRLNKKSNQIIPNMIRSFKSSVKRMINKQEIFFAWQPRFHDHIIKNQKEYFMYKNYIKNNIENWEKDKLYSKA